MKTWGCEKAARNGRSRGRSTGFHARERAKRSKSGAWIRARCPLLSKKSGYPLNLSPMIIKKATQSRPAITRSKYSITFPPQISRGQTSISSIDLQSRDSVLSTLPCSPFTIHSCMSQGAKRHRFFLLGFQKIQELMKCPDLLEVELTAFQHDFFELAHFEFLFHCSFPGPGLFLLRAFPGQTLRRAPHRPRRKIMNGRPVSHHRHFEKHPPDAGSPQCHHRGSQGGTDGSP